MPYDYYGGYYPEPEMRAEDFRNKLAGDPPQEDKNWWDRYGLGGSAAMSERGPWMRQYMPQSLADFLASALMYAPMAMASWGGAGMAQRAVSAARSGDPGITGGSREAPYSSAGLASHDSVHAGEMPKQAMGPYEISDFGAFARTRSANDLARDYKGPIRGGAGGPGQSPDYWGSARGIARSDGMVYAPNPTAEMSNGIVRDPFWTSPSGKPGFREMQSRTSRPANEAEPASLDRMLYEKALLEQFLRGRD